MYTNGIYYNVSEKNNKYFIKIKNNEGAAAIITSVSLQELVERSVLVSARVVILPTDKVNYLLIPMEIFL